MANDTMPATHDPQEVKETIINMTQTMLNIKEESDQLLKETYRILQETANSPTTQQKQGGMPEMRNFVEESLVS